MLPTTYIHHHAHISDESGSDLDEDQDEARARAPNVRQRNSSPIARREIIFSEVRLTSEIRTKNSGLLTLYRGRRGLLQANTQLHPDTWDTVLCEGVPLSVRELTSLTLVQLGLRDDQRNRNTILRCSWTLGWHLTTKTPNGVTYNYWGGGVTPSTTSRYLRGDWVEIAGTEECRHVHTSRMGRIICGVRINNISKIFGADVIDNEIWENQSSKDKDSVVYVHAYAHPDTKRQRGPKHRPLCPGEMKDTHCLWKWHERAEAFRRGCWRPRPWSRHCSLFGETESQQHKRNKQEAKAWYDVIQASDIVSYANVQTDWDRPESFIQCICNVVLNTFIHIL